MDRARLADPLHGTSELLIVILAHHRSGSRRSSAAIELSKGAIRAIRARARTDSKGTTDDWSDASRATSPAPSQADSLDQPGPCRTQSYAYDRPAHGDVPYLSEGMLHAPYFHPSGEAMAYAHPDFKNWPFDQHSGSQGYAYPPGPSCTRESVIGPD